MIFRRMMSRFFRPPTMRQGVWVETLSTRLFCNKSPWTSASEGFLTVGTGVAPPL